MVVQVPWRNLDPILDQVTEHNIIPHNVNIYANECSILLRETDTKKAETLSFYEEEDRTHRSIEKEASLYGYNITITSTAYNMVNFTCDMRPNAVSDILRFFKVFPYNLTFCEFYADKNKMHVTAFMNYRGNNLDTADVQYICNSLLNENYMMLE